MYPAHTQLLAKWSSPSIGDRRATGCLYMIRVVTKCVSARQLIFYLCLTLFRVLTISYVIVAFHYAAILIYAALFLGIIVLGYLRTSREADFIVRGLRSSVTTGLFLQDSFR